MRKQDIIKGEFYHLSNIGSDGRQIFFDDEDYARFLYLITHLQSPVHFNHLTRPLPYFQKHGNFKTSEHTTKAIAKSRYVELVAFFISPTRFDLIVRETKDGGIPYFMHRIQNAYAKFSNTKHKRRGHFFQGPYRYKLIADENQLKHFSAELHLKAKSLTHHSYKEDEYPWSSFQDYFKNRWGSLLAHEYITDKFKNEKEYRRFVLHAPQKVRRQVLENLSISD